MWNWLKNILPCDGVRWMCVSIHFILQIMDLPNEAASQAANSLLTAQPSVKRNASFKRLLKLPMWGNDKSGMFRLLIVSIYIVNVKLS